MSFMSNDLNWNHLLRSHRLWWKIETLLVKNSDFSSKPGEDLDGKLFGDDNSTLRVTIYDADDPPSFSVHKDLHPYFSSTTNSLGSMLVSCVKAHKKHPRLADILERWRHHACYVPVRVLEDRVQNIGECMHRAIRVLIDGPNSTILWSAIDKMWKESRSDDLNYNQWSVICRASENAIRAAMNSALEAGAQLLRRDIAFALKNAWIDAAESNLCQLNMDQRDHPRSADLEYRRFVGSVFLCSTKGLDFTDWAHGVCGYLVEDLTSTNGINEASG